VEDEGVDRPASALPKSKTERKPAEKPASKPAKGKPEGGSRRTDADKPPELKKSQPRTKLSLARVEFKT
jgi:hypothetical protein